MFSFEILDQNLAPYYCEYTFPFFREYLKSKAPLKNALAIGVNYDVMPIGLGLAKIDGSTAKILSVCLHQDFRNMGLGTSLYLELEKHLKSQGVDKISLSYMSKNPSTPFLEKLLVKQGFKCDFSKMRHFQYFRDGIRKSPWVHNVKIPEKFDVFPLVNWTQKDQDDYKKIIARGDFPKELEIEEKEYPLEPKTSVGMRINGEFVGWLANHKISQDIIRYTSLYLHPKINQIRSTYLFVKALQIVCSLPQNNMVLQTVPHKYPTMLSLVMRKFAPYSSKVQEGMIAEKIINANPVI